MVQINSNKPNQSINPASPARGTSPLRRKLVTASVLTFLNLSPCVFAQDLTLQLSCREAFQDASGAWQAGSEKTQAEIEAIFAGTPGSVVCNNFLNSGGALNETFASTGVYCQCAQGQTVPAPTPCPIEVNPFQAEFHSPHWVVASSSRLSHKNVIRRLKVFGVGADIQVQVSAGVTQSRSLGRYHLELFSDASNRAGVAALRACDRVIRDVLRTPGASLRIESKEVPGTVYSLDRGKWKLRVKSLLARMFGVPVSLDLGELEGVTCELKR